MVRRQISLGRRNFIKNTTMASAAMAASSIFGAPESSAASMHKKWDKETDIVIVGSGIAGMSAAIEAADGGATVIVLEKDAQPGGAAKLSGGHMAVAGTDVEARAGVEDKPDWLYQDMMEDSEMTAVPELIRAYVDGGPELIRWMEHLGIRFTDFFTSTSNVDRIKEEVYRGHQIAPSPDYPGGWPLGHAGIGLMTMLNRAADKRGTNTLLRHKMTKIVRPSASGPVIGVEVESEGKSITIKAKRAVIVTTGGWSGNLQMGLAEDPRMTPDVYPDCWPYHLCLGEGHMTSLDVGAELSNMAWGGYLVQKWGTRVYQLWEPPTFSTSPTTNVGVRIVDFQHVILVKNNGERYVNESLGDPEGTPDPINPKFRITPDSFPDHPFNVAYLDLEERPRNVWAVADSEGAKRLGWLLHVDQMRNPNPKSGIALYPEMVAIADSLQGLAAKMNVNPTGLDITVGRYNKFVEAGKDEDFGKPGPAYKIAKSPFYAVKAAMLKHTRRNGIRVNTRSQVLDRSGFLAPEEISISDNFIDEERTIPHLYAAGECANYLGRYHSHGTLGIYSFYGRVAGKNAATEELLT